MKYQVPFLDLRVTDEAERRELLEAFEGVLRHGRLVMGPEVEQLETEVARYCGRRFAVSVGSGSSALYLALRALGIGAGDEVITTSLSWIATANAIALTGATPVFADIDDDLNIDPSSVRRLIGRRTRAIVPVHYTGKVCRMDALAAIAGDAGLLLVEDAAQAFGATLRGRAAGSFGDAASFSMNPMKVFAALGEAGVVVTDREDVRDRLVRLRYNGTVNRETCLEPGPNGRMDTVQAALLLRRLSRLPAVLSRRREIAGVYAHHLAGVVGVPVESPEQRDVYYTYQIQCDRRDALKAFLEGEGIETKIQHPIAMPDQPAYAGEARGEFSNARRLIARILCIPVHEKLTDEDLDHVVDSIVRFGAGPG